MITVLIERHIAPDMDRTYENFARKVIQDTVLTPGFVSGEAFRGVDDPHTRYIVLKMKSKEDWLRWVHSAERRELVAMVGPLLTVPEKVTLLAH